MRSPMATRFVRRLFLGAGLAAGFGFAVAAPSTAPVASAEPPAVVTASGRSITPGKRRDEVVDVYDRVKASVVNIHSERTVNTPGDDPFSRTPVRPQQVNGMGTGIVLDPRGYILTNFHVIEDVSALRVRLHDGTGYPARVVGTDKEADLALVKIDPARPLPVMPPGTSTDLMVGEPVIAIGNAFGYEHTVTQGRVSFKGRDVSLNKDTGYKNLIQTSAPINPGNSGGPLLNVLGELVGVNVAIRAGAQNIGFALPIDYVVGRAANMMALRRGGVRHGLSVRSDVIRDATEGPVRRSVAVESVEAGSAAAAAGFKAGDVIDRVDDVPVLSAIDLERGLLDKPAGKLAVRVTRGGAAVEPLELALEPATKAISNPVDLAWRRLGVKLNPVGADAVARANPQLRGGLLVTEVVPGGVAGSAGIQRGDILVGLHTWETLRVDDVAFVLTHRDYATFLPLKFFLARDGKLRDGHLAGSP
ncbi:trypsin-like peptidase domain-containing protein [Urbifossiella limnaea]|uniref:Periplasmic serine endoprotease DegP n=1 Tax=Urbifossiella limnaea TaxID=2528023 RepID=A0A517XRM2_9BACT|nr:trypsin-like peptidase domain-containing protein [Urbifossiella limnaea]QDU20161.1 Periplasmic serine endoprotease DegP precursor [Urbifossiella limnaea]